MTIQKVALLAAIVAAASSVTMALPRFAVSTGAKCQSCHVNPTGGEMRQAFGVRYGREELPVPTWSQSFEMEDFTNVLTNVIGVGADFRTLYFYEHGGNSNSDAFWQMQGDLYLNFHLAKKVSLFLNKGLYSGFEAFGLFNLLPANGYFKVGKFLPDYGIRQDDHTTFVRTYTGFSPELGRPELTGLEAAVSPGPLTITGGFYNASDGFGAATGNAKAYLGRAEGMFGLADHVNLWLGADVFGNGTLSSSVLARIATVTGGVLPAATGAVTNTIYGAFGALGIHDLTVQGEVDMMKTKISGATTTGILAYAEANYPVVTGVDLKLMYDFYDPDKDFKTGTISRYSFGFEFFPIAGVEVRPLYRIVSSDNTDLKSEFHFMLHLYL